ncbi:hypothetical protein RPHASCH2410_CH15080 [Rhizobium phaseoli Ch24-10]|nr:hypothetical protein RPHASCH2410_CH15080 [Rhizobium phaseoli Ch24-10]
MFRLRPDRGSAMAAQALAALNFRHDFNGRDMAGRRSRRQMPTAPRSLSFSCRPGGQSRDIWLGEAALKIRC